MVPAPLIQEVDEAGFEQIMQLSTLVPVVVDLWATWCGPCKQLGPTLEAVTQEYGGKFALVKVDVDQCPRIAQAFQAQTVPTVVALLAGRPVPLFQGAYPKAEIRKIIDQLLQLASQAGVTGVIGEGGKAAAPEPQLSGEEKEIYALVDADEIDKAIALAEKTLRNNPEDKQRYQLLVDQLKLQARLTNPNVGEPETPLEVADACFASGDYQKAFSVLLEQVAKTSDEEREEYRARMIELLRLCEDPSAVKAARAQLSKLLF